MADYETGTFNNWTFHRIGNVVTYVRRLTLLTTPNAFELPFLRGVQLNKIEQYFNSANARTFNVRMFGGNTQDAYSELDSQTANTGRSRVLQLGQEYKYPNANKVQFNYSAFTDSDQVEVMVTVEEL